MNGGVVFSFGRFVLGCLEIRPDCGPPAIDVHGGPDRIVCEPDDPGSFGIHVCFGGSGPPLAWTYPVLRWDNPTSWVAGAPDTEIVEGGVFSMKTVAVGVE